MKKRLKKTNENFNRQLYLKLYYHSWKRFDWDSFTDAKLEYWAELHRLAAIRVGLFPVVFYTGPLPKTLVDNHAF